MARFISSIGQITGKLGGVVFKRRGNKIYVSKAPGHLKPTKDPATKLRRKKFAWVGKFASAVNSFPLLKSLWNSASSRSHSAFNGIFKQVFNTFPSGDYSGPIVFTPAGGFQLQSSSVVFGKSSLFIEISSLPCDSDIDPKIELSVIAAGIMVLSDPIHDSLAEEFFLPVQSDKIPVSLNNPSVLIIPLKGSDLSIYESYLTKKAYLTLVTLDASGNPIHHSVIIS
jgi:hypothetical protein